MPGPERLGLVADGYDTISRMSRSQLIRHWERDLRGLTDEQLRDRLALAEAFERSSMRKGMGRNPKAARDWRERRDQVEAEMERRRGLPVTAH